MQEMILVNNERIRVENVINKYDVYYFFNATLQIEDSIRMALVKRILDCDVVIG